MYAPFDAMGTKRYTIFSVNETVADSASCHEHARSSKQRKINTAWHATALQREGTAFLALSQQAAARNHKNCQRVSGALAPVFMILGTFSFLGNHVTRQRLMGAPV